MNIYNLPNWLTILRIVLIPVFIAFYITPYNYSNELALATFVIAAVTDWLDGYLARALNQTSKFGAFLDPVADKLMVCAALVVIVYRDPQIVVALSAIVIIGREITISALREWMAELGKRGVVAVSMLGKIKTTVQMIAIALLIYRQPIGEVNILLIGKVLLVISAILTLWSMICYLKASIKVIQNEPENNEK